VLGPLGPTMCAPEYRSTILFLFAGRVRINPLHCHPSIVGLSRCNYLIPRLPSYPPPPLIHATPSSLPPPHPPDQTPHPLLPFLPPSRPRPHRIRVPRIIDTDGPRESSRGCSSPCRVRARVWVRLRSTCAVGGGV